MLNILIVEDNADFRQSLKEVLHSQFPFLVVGEAENGDEALQKIDALVPDIIFMDIKLPGENGLQVTQKVKKKYPEIIIIILTYYDSPEHRKAADQCGANYFLPKNTSIQEVMELVQSILSEKGLESYDPKGKGES
ncbi:MAG: response regulator transcription factor [Thermodesulfobacteriota bacterium]